MRRAYIFSLIFVVICGCTHTELTRRYKSKNFDTAPREYVEVSAFVMKTPPAPQHSLLSQLTPDGQAALISKLAEWSKSPDELYQALAASEKGGGGSEGTIDKTVFNKRVVFSVQKEPPGKDEGDLTPADRINELKVTLKLPAKESEEKKLNPAIKGGNEKEEIKKRRDLRPDAIFADWNQFDTTYQTVNLGTLQRIQHTTVGANLNVGPAAQVKVPVEGSANISRDTSIDEKINLGQRFIAMTGAIKDPKTAVLFQESQVGLDLAGNFIVDFTITIKNYNHSGIIIPGAFEKDGKPLKADEVKIDFGNLIYPVNSAPVECDLKYNYTIRHLRQLPLYDRYDRELAEGLHRVVFLRGESIKENKVELISRKELTAVIYEICLDGHPLYLGRPVDKLKDSAQPNEEIIGKNPLRFMKFDDAKKFLVWLKEPKPTKKESKSASIGKYKIYLNDDYEIKNFDKLRIRAKQLNY